MCTDRVKLFRVCKYNSIGLNLVYCYMCSINHKVSLCVLYTWTSLFSLLMCLAFSFPLFCLVPTARVSRKQDGTRGAKVC